MALSPNSELRRCAQCNRLMRGDTSRRLCSECAGEKISTDPPVVLDADATIAEKVARLRAELELGRQTPEPPAQAPVPGMLAGEDVPTSVPGTACVLCGLPVLPNSVYCLRCHAGLHRNLGEAMVDLRGRIHEAHVPRRGMGQVSSGLEEKRERAATSRINPSGARRLKR